MFVVATINSLMLYSKLAFKTMIARVVEITLNSVVCDVSVNRNPRR